MRSIWRGAVSFGLVSIGVKLYSATEDKDVRFHQVHEADGGRVKYKRVCSIDGEELEYGDIAKGYELPDGQLVILTDEDLDELPLASRREIDVLQFVQQEQIDPVHFEKTYYLEPDGPATRPYVLLRNALENTGQVAITKIALRQRESLAALRVRDGVLVLHTMRWPDEIRRPDFDFLDEDVAVRPQELQMAEALITSMAGDFDPGEFHDDYREAMTSLLEAKATGGEVQPVPEVGDTGAAVVDLMSALRRSVERARGGAAEDEDEEPAPTRRPRKATADSDADSDADTDAPAPARRARKAAAEEAPARRPRKAAAEEAPARRARKAAAEEAPARRPRKAAAEEAPAPAKRAARTRRSA